MSSNLGSLIKKYAVILIVIVIVVIGGMFLYKLIFGSEIAYNKIEDLMVSGAQKYFRNRDLPTDNGEVKVVTINSLVETGNMKPMSKLTKDTCEGKVSVRKNGSQYLYLPSLDCENHKTKTMFSVLINEDTIVTKADGVYQMGDEYVYRGEKVKNYVSFGSRIWRIIKIDDEGIMKLISTTAEEKEAVWDNRYNVDVKERLGINDFSVSRIKDRLNSIYNGMSNKNKKHLIAKSVCVGSRNTKNKSLNSGTECSETIADLHISLPNIKDRIVASIDENCKDLSTTSCVNYNYFTSFFSSSYTTLKAEGNSHQVIYINSITGLYKSDANEEREIFLVVHIDSNELYSSGNGTWDNPYVIK